MKLKGGRKSKNVEVYEKPKIVRVNRKPAHRAEHNDMPYLETPTSSKLVSFDTLKKNLNVIEKQQRGRRMGVSKQLDKIDEIGRKEGSFGNKLKFLAHIVKDNI